MGRRFAYVTRRAGDRGALRAGVHPSLLPGGRSLGEAGAVESRWTTAVEPGARPRLARHPRGVCGPRDRRPVSRGRRSAPRLPRCRPRQAGTGERAGEDRAVAGARLAGAVRGRVPPGRGLPREGRARHELGGSRAAPPARPRPRGHVPSRLGDLREPRVRVRRRPRASRRSTSSTRRWASSSRRWTAAESTAPAAADRGRRRVTASRSSPTRCSWTRVGCRSGPTS